MELYEIFYNILLQNTCRRLILYKIAFLSCLDSYSWVSGISIAIPVINSLVLRSSSWKAFCKKKKVKFTEKHLHLRFLFNEAEVRHTYISEPAAFKSSFVFNYVWRFATLLKQSSNIGVFHWIFRFCRPPSGDCSLFFWRNVNLRDIHIIFIQLIPLLLIFLVLIVFLRDFIWNAGGII